MGRNSGIQSLTSEQPPNQKWLRGETEYIVQRTHPIHTDTVDFCVYHTVF